MDEESKKLDDLSYRIAKAEAHSVPIEEPAKGRNAGFDFAGALIGSGMIGILLDYFFHTSPWFLLGMVIFGFIAGMMSAWRAISKSESN